jgi:NAD(P)-dependent dehydrogenase (short-subunit alcohol dehydrogenase family)
VQEFQGRVAVVTGGASGIGLALARTLGAQGMKLVLADVEADALDRAARELEKEGIENLAVVTDVSRAQDVDALAQQALGRFGAVHVVCNNAGVFSGGGAAWEVPLEDYEWVWNVNVWGVVHGVRSFVPILLEQGEEGHVVNTASMAGVTSMAWSAAYCMSKHAVVALSESLHHELRFRQAPIGVSVLCPEAVATHIDRADRNRPASLLPPSAAASAEREMVDQSIRDAVRQGTPPKAIAERVLSAIRENRFYVLSDDVWRRACEARLEDIRLGRNPTFVPPVEAE